MRKVMLALLAVALCIVPLHAATPSLAIGIGQSTSGSIQVDLSWNAPGCASSIGTNSTGTETSGPCYGQVYRVSVATGAACPAFSLSTWTELAQSVPIISASATYADQSITIGQSYCYAVTDTFQAGGAPSALSNLFPIQAVIPGQPGTPTITSATPAP